MRVRCSGNARRDSVVFFKHRARPDSFDHLNADPDDHSTDSPLRFSSGSIRDRPACYSRLAARLLEPALGSDVNAAVRRRA